jgi:hypothetical protein
MYLENHRTGNMSLNLSTKSLLRRSEVAYEPDRNIHKENNWDKDMSLNITAESLLRIELS